MSINFEALARCNRASSEWTYQINNEQGEKRGEFKARILRDEDDLNSLFHFDNDGGFGEFKAQIPMDKVFPIAVLEKIDIIEDYRKLGFGSDGLLQFYEQAKERGAMCGFLRASTSCENSNRAWNNPFATHFQKNICFYEKNGWALLKNYGNRTVPYMYHSLQGFVRDA